MLRFSHARKIKKAYPDTIKKGFLDTIKKSVLIKSYFRIFLYKKRLFSHDNARVRGLVMGRKLKQIDWDLFEQLCKELPTMKAIAARLDICVDVLRKRIRERYDDVFTYVHRDIRSGRKR